MRLKQYFAIIIFIVPCFMTALSPLSDQDEEIVYLLDKITERLDSYPETRNWKALLLIKDRTMDEQGQRE